jgi:Raf kinase inhibitor-like YbhB/YbcL family protein
MRKIPFFSLLAGLLVNTAEAASLNLTTSSFANYSAISTAYTCDGNDISPQLAWENTPAKTVTLALVLSDPDAPGGTWYHWLVYNIPAATKEFPENISSLPVGALIGKNSFGNNRYNGPCPPKGSLHNYIFTLYALDAQLTLPAGVDFQILSNAMKSHVIQKASVSGTFSH